MNSTSIEHNEGHASRWFQPQRAAWWDSVLLAFLLVAMSSQINLGDIGRDTFRTEGYVTKQLKIALPDIALMLAFGWFVVRTTAMRAWRRLWWPPLPCWALLFAMLLAFVHSDSIWSKAAQALDASAGQASWKVVLKDKSTFQAIKEAIADIIQYGLYFLVAPCLFVNLLHDRRGAEFINRRLLALSAFAAGIACALLLALIQSLTDRNLAPQGWFGSPNAFAAWVALVFPLCACFALFELKGKELKLDIARFGLQLLLILGVLTLVVSPWSVLAILVGILTAALLLRSSKRIGILLFILVPVLALLMWPRDGNSPRAQYAQLKSATQPVKKQYVEWYAALGWSLPQVKAFATGVGPGNYQGNIGTYYVSLPNEEKMPPDSNNLYLVQSVALGFLGLGTLLWVIFHFARVAWQARAAYPDDWLATGVLASLVSWLVVNGFHAMIVRGSGVVLAFILALAVVALHLNWVQQPVLAANNTNDGTQPGV